MNVQNSQFRFLFVWIVNILAFALVYWFLSDVPGNGLTGVLGLDPITRFLESLYFSVVTGTTVGYGDILPLGASRFFAALEAVTSFVLLAVFVSKLATRSQDIALAKIHALSEDASFNNIRHGLFIARKDMDVIIKKVIDRGEEMSDKDWKNLRTAFRQLQIFIRNIPNFYHARKQFGGIDADREHLLLDSTERSLRRTIEVIDMLNQKGLACTADGKCQAELHSIAAATEFAFVRNHSKEVSHENEEMYNEVIERFNELKDRLN